MASILPMDELNRLDAALREQFGDGELPKDKAVMRATEDLLEDLFLFAYAMGYEVTSNSLSSIPYLSEQTTFPSGGTPSYERTASTSGGTPSGNRRESTIDSPSSRINSPSLEEIMKVVDAKVAGKTWRERVEDYFSNGGTGADISRIADTETHRIANTAALKTARKAGATTKTWVTMADERVRDTHAYLEMETVGIDEDFYAFDGDHAPAPGLFELPENNINCRCELLFS